MRFEKAKESIFHRKYKKLDSVLAEIGGIAKALMIIGFIICMPINQLKLHQQLSNSLFTFNTRNNVQQSHEPKFEGQKLIQIIEATQQYNKNQQLHEAEQSTKHLNAKDHFFKSSSQQKMMSLEQIIEPIILKDSKAAKENSHVQFSSHTQKCTSYQQSHKNEDLGLNTKQISQNFDLIQQSDAKVNQPSSKVLENNISPKKMAGNNLLQIIKAQKKFKKSLIDIKPLSLQQKEETNNLNSQTNNNLENNTAINNEVKNDQNQENSVDKSKPNNKYNNDKLKVANSDNHLEKIHNNENNNCNRNDNKTEDINFFRPSRKSVQLNENPFQSNCQVSPSDHKKNEKEEGKQLELKWADYIKYYIFPWGTFSKKKKEIDYSIEKIYQHLDMLYIVQKLLELEKIKQLLLDEDQMRLISFLPKPLIDVDKLDEEKQQKEKQLRAKQMQRQYSENPKLLKKSHAVTMLDDVVIDEQEKAKQAYLALNNIMKKDKLTKIDKKIIEMMDNSIIENIENYVEYLEQIDTEVNQNDNNNHNNDKNNGEYENENNLNNNMNKNVNNRLQVDGDILSTAKNQLFSEKNEQYSNGNLNNEEVIIELQDSDDDSSYNKNEKNNNENNQYDNKKNETNDQQDSKNVQNYIQNNFYISPQINAFSPMFNEINQNQSQENKGK